MNATFNSQLKVHGTAHRCRHRRVRRLPLATFAAAIIVLTAATGVHVGHTVGSMDALKRTTTCEAP